jgi:hypothetical protein
MRQFERLPDLIFNRGLIADPEAFAGEAHAAAWLFLCGEEFAAHRAPLVGVGLPLLRTASGRSRRALMSS